ncbi:MAG: hypothetical protein QM539_09320 [Alphaproteobacteria bacterium]|nr:hypothetical protein [Alphaproteobacteria bacterium]
MLLNLFAQESTTPNNNQTSVVEKKDSKKKKNSKSKKKTNDKKDENANNDKLNDNNTEVKKDTTKTKEADKKGNKKADKNKTKPKKLKKIDSLALQVANLNQSLININDSFSTIFIKNQNKIKLLQANQSRGIGSKLKILIIIGLVVCFLLVLTVFYVLYKLVNNKENWLKKRIYVLESRMAQYFQPRLNAPTKEPEKEQLKEVPKGHDYGTEFVNIYKKIDTLHQDLSSVFLKLEPFNKDLAHIKSRIEDNKKELLILHKKFDFLEVKLLDVESQLDFPKTIQDHALPSPTYHFDTPTTIDLDMANTQLVSEEIKERYPTYDKPEVFYLGAANDEGSFKDILKTNVFVRSSSIYECTKISPNMAEFSICNDLYIITLALELYKKLIEPMCEAENVVRNAKNFVTLSKGTLKFDESAKKWYIIKKAKIQYLYS